MRFECNIDMSNDAFAHDPHYELSKIIKTISHDVDDFVCISRTKILRDTNGGKVGTWKIIGE